MDTKKFLSGGGMRGFSRIARQKFFNPIQN